MQRDHGTHLFIPSCHCRTLVSLHVWSMPHLQRFDQQGPAEGPCSTRVSQSTNVVTDIANAFYVGTFFQGLCDSSIDSVNPSGIWNLFNFGVSKCRPAWQWRYRVASHYFFSSKKGYLWYADGACFYQIGRCFALKTEKRQPRTVCPRCVHRVKSIITYHIGIIQSCECDWHVVMVNKLTNIA